MTLLNCDTEGHTLPNIHYETNCEQYVLMRDGKPVMRPLDEIALCVAVDSDGCCILHKHGDPESVRKWAESTQAVLRAQGNDVANQMAAEIQVHQGKFDLQDLNLAVQRNQNALARLTKSTNVIDVDATIVEDAPDPSRAPRP